MRVERCHGRKAVGLHFARLPTRSGAFGPALNGLTALIATPMAGFNSAAASRRSYAHGEDARPFAGGHLPWQNGLPIDIP